MIGRQDLGMFVIMSEEDIIKLGIKLNRLQKIDNFRTPSKSINSVFPMNEKRLRKYIERSAKREKADVAVITRQTHEFTPLAEYISCEYSLYKYK
ncbi:MAG: hypothetical protein NTU63_02395 [Candidatus Pacearchaeota archaeon]|nr:hypothetical protein [Candidatus Pacearchaeota archaeon]